MSAERVAIIGAGPAGIATAIQLKRSGIEPVLLERNEVGGLLRNANLVENYPGFPDGISGPDLVRLFREQLRSVGVDICFERVHELEYAGSGFSAKTARRTITSSFVVVATGTKPKVIAGLPIPDDIEDRVFYEVHSIVGLRNKKIAIIGAGDAAFDYALNLSPGNDVTILARSARARCLPLLEERCRASATISYLGAVTVKEVEEAGGGVLITCVGNDEPYERAISVDYVVIAVGREPSLDFLGPELTKRWDTLTRMKRLYAVGDVKNGLYRQTAIAVGDGIRAAMRIVKSLHG